MVYLSQFSAISMARLMSATIDTHFTDAGSDRAHISQVAEGQAIHAYRDSHPGLPITQGRKPGVKRGGPEDLYRRQSVNHG
jgi:hypothetical protein